MGIKSTKNDRKNRDWGLKLTQKLVGSVLQPAIQWPTFRTVPRVKAESSNLLFFQKVLNAVIAGMYLIFIVKAYWKIYRKLKIKCYITELVMIFSPYLTKKSPLNCKIFGFNNLKRCFWTCRHEKCKKKICFEKFFFWKKLESKYRISKRYSM